MVAAPGLPGNVLPVARLERDVPVDIAYVGTCTGGKREDIRRAYEVARWALDRGLTLPLQVQLFIQVGSEDVRRHAEAQGWLSAFEEAGARVISPGCGACIHAGPGLHPAGTGDRRRLQQQFPGPQRPRLGVARQPRHRGRQRLHGPHRHLPGPAGRRRAPDPARVCFSP